MLDHNVNHIMLPSASQLQKSQLSIMAPLGATDLLIFLSLNLALYKMYLGKTFSSL